MPQLFGGKTKEQKAQDKTFSASFDPLIKQQSDASKFALDKAKPLLDEGTSTLKGPLDYWKTLLSGDRGGIASLLGPELDAIGGRDAAARSSFSQFAPRGTSMGSRLGELNQTTQGDINRNFLSARPQAAEQLSQLAQLLFGTGTGLFNASTGASGNSLQALLGNKSDNTANRQIGQTGLQQGIGLMARIGFGV